MLLDQDQDNCTQKGFAVGHLFDCKTPYVFLESTKWSLYVANLPRGIRAIRALQARNKIVFLIIL
jgi:hypothetical protein